MSEGSDDPYRGEIAKSSFSTLFQHQGLTIQVPPWVFHVGFLEKRMVGWVNYGEIVRLATHLEIDLRPSFDQWSGSRVISLYYQMNSVTL